MGFHAAQHLGETRIALQDREIVDAIATGKIEQDQRHQHLPIAPPLGTPTNADVPFDRLTQAADGGQLQVGRQPGQRGHPASTFLFPDSPQRLLNAIDVYWLP